MVVKYLLQIPDNPGSKPIIGITAMFYLIIVDFKEIKIETTREGIAHFKAKKLVSLRDLKLYSTYHLHF